LFGTITGGRRLDELKALTYGVQMSELFRCSHCGALYEAKREKTVSGDKKAAECQVCGKQMESTDGLIARYELVQMPDGTNV
jgi:transcription elongation factor Elf1